MKWVITEDHIGTKRQGTGNYTLSILNKLTVKFRLYDDDGILYYEGKASESNFDPLDWAMPYAGCTIMKVWNPTTKQWEVL